MSQQDWPYTQFSEAGGIIMLSGQTALEHGELVEGGIREHAIQAIRNCLSIVHRLGLGEDHVTHVRVALRDVGRDQAEFDKVYREMFPDPQQRPPRTLFGAEPVGGSLVDIEMTLSRVVPKWGPPGEPEDEHWPPRINGGRGFDIP